MSWLSGMCPTWQRLFQQREYRQALRIVKRKLGEQNKPLVPKVFRSFSYFDVRATKVIILGQDPYPNPKNASGLSFSSDGVIPASLRNIYRCLQHHQLIKNTPTTANLEPWVQQGVLLLNRYLTLGGDFWTVFTDFLLYNLSQIPWDRPVFLCLWGNVAQSVKYELDVYSSLTVLEWSHPSPMNRQNQDPKNKGNFVYCDHFTKISTAYPDFTWTLS